jgi:fibronectin-binding autotransporter adhesin
LQGNGTVGNLTVNGNIAPGNSIGTLNVNGNYTQAAGSTYTVETNAAGQSDLINVTGTATLLGGTVKVLAALGSYSPSTTYTIVNTTGGVTGTFAGVTDNLPFLDASLIHNPSTVQLNLARNDLTFANPIVGQTPNQIAVATNLDRLEARATGDLRTVFNKLVSGNIAQARTALDDLGGEIHATGLSLDLNAHQVFLDPPLPWTPKAHPNPMTACGCKPWASGMAALMVTAMPVRQVTTPAASPWVAIP